MPVVCPFHEDSSPSASINFSKKLFNCFKCNKGYSFVNLEKELKSMEKSNGSKETPIEVAKFNGKPLTKSQLDKLAIKYLKSRGVYDAIPLKWQTISDYQDKALYGYLAFESYDKDSVVLRNIIDEDRPKYRNPSGTKSLFYVCVSLSKTLWLTEGLFDALTLHKLGVTNVATTNGAGGLGKNADAIAYSLRGKTVLILFDNDASGFKGAKKVSDKLAEFEVDHNIINFPAELGKDINEAFLKEPKKVTQFIKSIEDRYSPDDIGFINKQFSKDTFKPLNILPTGIPSVDKKLRGGFKDGGHIISGTTGIGKTALITAIAINGVRHGKRVLINSCEIPKEQMWARVASTVEEMTWEYIEEHPYAIKPTTKEWLKELAKNLKIVVGWPTSRIIDMKDSYDVVIIDYIQRAPGANEVDENKSRHVIDNYVSQLTNLGALYGKISLIVSSLGRQAYDKPDQFGLKESGGLEYMGTTVSRLVQLSDETLIWNLQKNTRGGPERIKLTNIDLGHCIFNKAKETKDATT